MGIFDRLSRSMARRTIATSIRMYRGSNPGAPFMEAIRSVLNSKEGWTPGSLRLCEPQIQRVYELKGEEAALTAAAWLDDQVVANYLERKRAYKTMGIPEVTGEAEFREEEEQARLDGREAELLRRSLESLPLDRF